MTDIATRCAEMVEEKAGAIAARHNLPDAVRRQLLELAQDIRDEFGVGPDPTWCYLCDRPQDDCACD